MPEPTEQLAWYHVMADDQEAATAICSKSLSVGVTKFMRLARTNGSSAR
jgi:hypothetical protein